MTGEAEDKKSLPEQIRGLRKVLSQVETVMRQTAHAGGVKLPPFTIQSMHQMQMELGEIARQVGDAQEEMAAYKEFARTSALINSSLDLDDVLNEVMDTVIALTGAERGYLMLVKEDTGELEFKVARDLNRETLDEADFAVSRSIVRQVAQSGEPVVTVDASEDPRFSAKASVVGFNLRSILCVPLTLRGKIIGAVYVDNKAMRGIFSERHLNLLIASANQAAIAIGNAKQFGRVKADLAEANRQVEELRIVIDEARRQAQVKSVTESQFFDAVRIEADRFRRRRHNKEKEKGNQG